MNYLRICDMDEAPDRKAKAVQRVAKAVRQFAELTERWELADGFTGALKRGQSRVYCEYDTLYLAIGLSDLAVWLAGHLEFQNRLRKHDVVRVFEGF